MILSVNTLFPGGRLLGAAQLLALMVASRKGWRQREQRAGYNNGTPRPDGK